MHTENQATYVYFTASTAVIAKRTLEGCSSNEITPAEKGIQEGCRSQDRHLLVMYETATSARGEWPSGITAEYS